MIFLSNRIEKLTKQSYYHPGFYYQCAAKFAFDRKKTAIRICTSFKSNPIVEKLLSEANSNASVDVNGRLFVSNQNTTYIGERPSQSSSHPLDLTSTQGMYIIISQFLENQSTKMSETDEIIRIHGLELKFDHSFQIIELLTKVNISSCLMRRHMSNTKVLNLVE